MLVKVPTAQTRAGDYIVYVGSYTNTTAKGIYASRFESKTGALSPLELVAEDVYPAQVWATPNGRFLYAANWQGTDAVPGDTITAYAINRHTAALTLLNKVKCGGSGPNQVVVDPSGKVAVAVNYRSGTVAAFAIEPDGATDRGVLHRSAHRTTDAAVAATGPACTRRCVQQRQQVRLRRRYRTRSRL